MPLAELSQARELSQKELARELKVGQPAVGKLEKRADMYVSNLRRYVQALGGLLEINARFPEGVAVPLLWTPVLLKTRIQINHLCDYSRSRISAKPARSGAALTSRLDRSIGGSPPRSDFKSSIASGDHRRFMSPSV